MENKFFTFIAPYLSAIDDGKFFRKPLKRRSKMSERLRLLGVAFGFVALLAIAGCADTTVQGQAVSSRQSVPPLDKATAAKILSSMGYTDVTVAAVVQAPALPMGGTSDRVSLVVAAVRRKGQAKAINEGFLYDPDLGWFYHEPSLGSSTERETVILWTAEGYREVAAASPK